MGADLPSAVKAARLNREDCKRTKHDSQFYKWQVLVGPSDWENHSLGVEGVSRYRLHNLPQVSSPGLYELGIPLSSSAKIQSDNVLVVYLGQADNVRTRLQRYGRSGAHLNNPNDSALKNGTGLFEDVFIRGFGIVFRWVPMKSKGDALKMEAQLLDIFDYAWNKGSNGARRHDDVLRKLDRPPPRKIRFPKLLTKILPLGQKPVGIKIRETKFLFPQQQCDNYCDDVKSKSFFPHVVMFSKSRPKLVLDGQGASDRNLIIGSFMSKSNGEVKIHAQSSDLETSVIGYRDMDTHGSLSSSSDSLEFEKGAMREGRGENCGVNLDEMSLCNVQFVEGNKRCNRHNCRKTCCGKDQNYSENSPEIDDEVCDLKSNTLHEKGYGSSVCKARTATGSYCKRPVKGKTHCWQHSTQITDEDSMTSSDQRKFGETSHCQLHTQNDSCSTKQGANSNEVTSLCGAPTQKGSSCKRQVKGGGGRCWQH